jgi:hypothetical protein
VKPSRPGTHVWLRMVPWVVTTALLTMGNTLAAADDTVRAARLSDVDGPVALLPSGSTDWTAALLNRPLSAGDQLATESGARAEIELGGGVVARLAADSEVALLALSEDGVQLALSAGSVSVAVRDVAPSQWIEIDSPQAVLSLLAQGDYRISLGRDGSTRVALQGGRAQLAGQTGENLSLRDGQGAEFAADGSLDVAVAQPPDAFDRWCAQRNQQWERARAQTAPLWNDVPGEEQLAQAGEWRDEPDTGEMWFPTQLPADWAPFQYGQWTYVGPWGWTWVDRMPWGYAPFHYGRWIRLGGRWGWVPPPPHAHPSFAPALVSVPANVEARAAAPVYVRAPPASAMRRPILAARPPTAQPSTLPRVVVTPALRALPVSLTPSRPPSGPTIYARDVRPWPEGDTPGSTTLRGSGRDNDNSGNAAPPRVLHEPDRPEPAPRPSRPAELTTPRTPVRPSTPMLSGPPAPPAAPPIPQSAPMPRNAASAPATRPPPRPNSPRSGSPRD